MSNYAEGKTGGIERFKSGEHGSGLKNRKLPVFFWTTAFIFGLIKSTNSLIS